MNKCFYCGKKYPETITIKGKRELGFFTDDGTYAACRECGGKYGNPTCRIAIGVGSTPIEQREKECRDKIKELAKKFCIDDLDNRIDCLIYIGSKVFTAEEIEKIVKKEWTEHRIFVVFDDNIADNYT